MPTAPHGDRLRGCGIASTPESVRLIHATLRAMFNAAVEDELRPDNPAARLGKQLRLVLPPKARQENIKAMDREQLAAFLTAAQTEAPRYAPLFLTLARTGLRLGEALALRWEDLDLGKRELRVARSLAARGRIDTPTSGHGRTVDVSQQLAAALRELRVQREAEKLRRGWREMPPWIFCTRKGTTFDRYEVTHTFKRVLKAAGLPAHFSPHSLRHTFASPLLQQGESPAYVQRQLGHASIQLTVDTYGKWLPLGNKAAVDQLDAPPAADRARCAMTGRQRGSGSRMVAADRSGVRRACLQVLNAKGGT